MSTTKRPPLLSDEQISNMAFLRPADARELYIADGVCEAYEAARAKDAELIQRLVNEIAALRTVFHHVAGYETRWGEGGLAAAEAHGFKPTEP